MHGISIFIGSSNGGIVCIVDSLLQLFLRSLAYEVELEVGCEEPACRTTAGTSTLGTDSQFAVDHENLLVGSHTDSSPFIIIPSLNGQHLGRLLGVGDGLQEYVLVVHAFWLCNQVGRQGVVTIRQTCKILSHSIGLCTIVEPCVPAAASALPVQTLVTTTCSSYVPAVAVQVGACFVTFLVEVGALFVKLLGEFPDTICKRGLCVLVDEPRILNEYGQVGRIFRSSYVNL